MTYLPMAGPPPIAYNLAGAAAAVGLSVSTIERYIREGQISVRYPNRKPIIMYDELYAWAHSRPDERP